MERQYIEDQIFEKLHVQESGFEPGEYEGCTFNLCDFSNTDLSGVTFITCAFNSCNLSLAKLDKTGFQDITFKDCKMLGLHFESCHKFGFAVAFENCQLNDSSFYQVRSPKTLFKDSKLQGVDFTECILTGSKFDQCDLAGAAFDRTNLEKVDFTTAYNYNIDPEINRLRSAKFSLLGVSGLLAKYHIDIVM